MNKVFQWEQKQEKEKEIKIEKEISKIIIDQNLVPCHSEKLFIKLGIYGPLNFNLKGIISCECAKNLMSFDGDENAMILLP